MVGLGEAAMEPVDAFPVTRSARLRARHSKGLVLPPEGWLSPRGQAPTQRSAQRIRILKLLYQSGDKGWEEMKEFEEYLRTTSKTNQSRP